MKLSPRLQKIADLIETGARLADVGTDHAHLPIYLLEQGIASSVIATDLHAGPLMAAKKNAAGMIGIDFRLADGLSAVCPHEVDTIVVAGMGGETIAHVLKEAPWTKEKGYRLILQVQSKVLELMTFLADNGYQIQAQHLVKDAGRIYPIYEVQGGQMPPMEAENTYIHASVLERKDPLLKEYLAKQIEKNVLIEQGLKKSNTSKEEVAVYEEEIKRLRKLEQEVQLW